MQNIEQKQILKMQDNSIQAGIILDQHEDLIAEIQDHIEKTGALLDESLLWDMVAAKNSPDWIASKNTLEDCRLDLEDRLSDDNIPLGLIGQAFDGGALDDSRDAYTLALCQFTILNEELRQRSDLQSTLSQLGKIQKQLKASYDISKQELKTTKKLEKKSALSALPSLVKAFGTRTFRVGTQAQAEQTVNSTKRNIFKKAAERKTKPGTPPRKRQRDIAAMVMHGFD